MPFLSFKSFVTSASRCAKVKDKSAFWRQANSTKKWALPQYVFYVPDQVRAITGGMNGRDHEQEIKGTAANKTLASTILEVS